MNETDIKITSHFTIIVIWYLRITRFRIIIKHSSFNAISLNLSDYPIEARLILKSNEIWNDPKSTKGANDDTGREKEN